LTTVVLAVGLSACIGAESTQQPKAPQRAPADYKCIFNHELLIISHKKDET
jgi:hypothetical protein